MLWSTPVDVTWPRDFQFSDDDDGTVGNYDEASIRYRGDYIPSPSFRLLQTLAKNDEARKKSGSRKIFLNVNVVFACSQPVVIDTLGGSWKFYVTSFEWSF